MRTVLWIFIWIGCALLLMMTGWHALLGEIGAENSTSAWAAAYRSPLDHVLAEYAIAHPDTRAARTGFFDAYRRGSAMQKPCSEPPEVFAYDTRTDVTGCTAVSATANAVHPWVRWLVPQKILIRVSEPVWSDPEARALILRTIESRTVLCSAARAETREGFSHPALSALNCDGDRAPRHQVYVVKARYPFWSCRPGPRPGSTICKGLSASDPGAIRVETKDEVSAPLG
jgi:hypothetical protein